MTVCEFYCERSFLTRDVPELPFSRSGSHSPPSQPINAFLPRFPSLRILRRPSKHLLHHRCTPPHSNAAQALRLPHHTPLQLLQQPSTRIAQFPARAPPHKKAIQTLQRLARRLGIEAPHDQRIDQVQDGKDDVRLIPDTLQRRRRNLHDEEVAQEVGRGREGSALGADLERENLRRVDPDGGHPAPCEEGFEGKDEDDGDDAGGGSVAGDADGFGDEDETHADCVDDEELAPADAVNGPPLGFEPSPQPSQHQEPPIRIPIVPHEPPRGIRHPDCDGQYVRRKHALKKQREPPLQIRFVEANAIVDPIRQHQSKQHRAQLAANLPAPVRRNRYLALINGRHARDIADPDPRDDSRNHKLYPLIGRSHQDATHHNNGRAQKKGPFSPQILRGKCRRDGAKYGTDVVQGGDGPNHYVLGSPMLESQWEDMTTPDMTPWS
ncbi:hypothetical protein DSL72_009163 [Monilinia vaccinii-corymbosi]|uniref:Uncharacterized protein n=1 Tax=Monilinia vaccinii-corymbosi TaxID=61207 RepID=A0A8A3PQD5_9HELO|nr:hypothetical protein DSL72_009163 [Monilinia vaccinii-corymbosi]